MLHFEHAWRFDTPGEIAPGVIAGFEELIDKIPSPNGEQAKLEHFKRHFSAAEGMAYSRSSSASWAKTDLVMSMQAAAQNAPVFIEAFFDACETLREAGVAVPNAARINRVLAENNAGYEIAPPNLIARDPQAPVAVEAQAPSLDAQAQEMIQKSLNESEKLLSEGRYRPAVQESLWLLETVSTAFQGQSGDAGTVQGRYFNKIAKDLRRKHQGQTLAQALDWAMALHGYLSSPTGGGVRHGTDLKAAVTVERNEARLFCNLTRSYITYLIAEYERLNRQ